MAKAKRHHADIMEQLMTRSSDSEYEDESAGDDDDDDDDDVDETESEPEQALVKREFAADAADDSDDSDDSDESDGSDESETEDEKPAGQLERREVSSAEIERAARYEAEERAIVVKEERGARDLFGDNDEDYNSDEAYSAIDETKEALFNSSEGEGETVDEKSESFTESLRASGGEQLSTLHEEVEEEAVDDLKAVGEKPLLVNDVERYEVKSVLWNVLAHVSYREKAALHRGQRVGGPPVEDPISHGDEFKRKFRWPVRLINLPMQDFAQDPIEIYNDYEIELTSTSSSEQAERKQAPHKSRQHQTRRSSAFAQVPRPIVEAVAAAAANMQRQARKRKRSQPEASPEGVTAATLTGIARIGERFTDTLLESLISENAAALQGTNNGYSQRSWTPLPVSRKPVANWRFVLENVLKQNAGVVGGKESESAWPALRPETLRRIRERLKTLNALPWKPDDNDLFASPTAPAEHGTGASASSTDPNVLIL